MTGSRSERPPREARRRIDTELIPVLVLQRAAQPAWVGDRVVDLHLGDPRVTAAGGVDGAEEAADPVATRPGRARALDRGPLRVGPRASVESREEVAQQAAVRYATRGRDRVGE